jgi:hypothetical protein
VEAFNCERGLVPAAEARFVRQLFNHWSAMSPDALFEEFRERLLGQQVTDRQLAGNSLSVWIASVPNQPAGYTVWFEPSWHVRGPGCVLAGSRQAQDEDGPAGWQAVSAAIDTLVGRVVEDIRRDAVSGDLELVLSGGVRVRSFVTDPRDEDLWRIRDLARKRELRGSPSGVASHEAA